MKLNGHTPKIWMAVMLVSLFSGTFFAQAPFAPIFAHSHSVFAFLSTFLVGMGLLCLFPDRWLWSERHLLAHAFGERHGLSGSSAKTALQFLEKALEQNHFLEEKAKFAKHLDHRTALQEAVRLHSIVVHRIFDRPQDVRTFMRLSQQTDLVIEALKKKQDLKRRQADSQTLLNAQAQIKTLLQQYNDIVVATLRDNDAQDSEKLQVAAEVATDLMQRTNPQREITS